jgi:tetratricopeptide (TPR) repeat protein
MGGRYGMSFAAELMEKGKYEEAVDAATSAMAGETENPEPYADRAAAYDYLERYAEAVCDLEKALTLNAAAPVIDQDNLDDPSNQPINAYYCVQCRMLFLNKLPPYCEHAGCSGSSMSG